MTIESTQKIMRRYLAGHETDALADDATFTMMGSSEVFRGPTEITQMLHRFYHDTFEAQAEELALKVGDGWAVLEAKVVGRLREPLAGVAPSDTEVRVPLCVVYELDDHAITSARIYLETDCLR